MSGIKINLGGFVPLSTVDWHGRSVCTLFFRGCPANCWYCHNRDILSGSDLHDTDEILEKIRDSKLLITGVVFSGGEATMQDEALIYLATKAGEEGLKTGLHTNGMYPKTLNKLIEKGIIDHIALDIKTTWEKYDGLMKTEAVEQVKQSLKLCRDAYISGKLPEFEVVVTLFPGKESEAESIAEETGDLELVLQQGIYNQIVPLTEEKLKIVADRIGRKLRIRTREEGEIIYEGNRDCRTARQR